MIFIVLQDELDAAASRHSPLGAEELSEWELEVSTTEWGSYQISPSMLHSLTEQLNAMPPSL